jgi:hypothetical protein
MQAILNFVLKEKTLKIKICSKLKPKKLSIISCAIKVLHRVTNLVTLALCNCSIYIVETNRYNTLIPLYLSSISNYLQIDYSVIFEMARLANELNAKRIVQFYENVGGIENPLSRR